MPHTRTAGPPILRLRAFEPCVRRARSGYHRRAALYCWQKQYRASLLRCTMYFRREIAALVDGATEVDKPVFLLIRALAHPALIADTLYMSVFFSDTIRPNASHTLANTAIIFALI